MEFAGDNFLRFSGDATNIQKLQLFAWNSAARGNDVHLNANPTQGSILHQQFQEKKEKLKDTTKVGILQKYGGEEYLAKVPRELLTGQTEDCESPREVVSFRENSHHLVANSPRQTSSTPGQERSSRAASAPRPDPSTRRMVRRRSLSPWQQ